MGHTLVGQKGIGTMRIVGKFSSETDVERCSIKTALQKILEHFQENSRVGVLF